MRLYKTGHPIADTISDIIGELPDDDYAIAYGILRGSAEYLRDHRHWFEIDRGFYGASHYDGMYRLSYRGTQPIYDDEFSIPGNHSIGLSDWRNTDGYILICPPTTYVSDFFSIDLSAWLFKAISQAGPYYKIRYKGDQSPIQWDEIGKLITFNSTLGYEALIRGIPVISDPDHSTIGSYTKFINSIDNYNRQPIIDFIANHQFKLHEKDKIWNLIKYYKCSADGIAEKP